MPIQIGEKIRELRLRDNKTQNEMAKALGITPQAVSRWESGISYPDVEMFPKIAEYFGVSIDRLYGRAADERELEIEHILKSVRKLRRTENASEQIQLLLRDAIRKYPKEYRFMLELCNVLHRLSQRTAGDDPDTALRYAIESAHWGETILAESGDTNLRCEAAHTLKYIYTENAEMGFKIDQLAESMPPMQICRENILCYVTDKEEAFRSAQWFSQECLINIAYFTDWYKDPAERAAVKRTVLDMIRLYFPDGDYDMHWHYRLIHLHIECADAELSSGCPDAALDVLEELLSLMENLRRRADGTNEHRHSSVTTSHLRPYPLYAPRFLSMCRDRIASLLETNAAFPQIAENGRYLRFRSRLDELADARP